MNDLDLENKNTLTSNIPPAIALFFGITGVFILYQIVGGLILFFIFGADMLNTNFNALRIYQVASQYIFILLPAIFLSKLFFNDVTTVMRIKKIPLKETGFFCAGIILVSVMAVDLQALQDIAFRKIVDFFPALEIIKVNLDELNKVMEESYKRLLSFNSVWEFLLVVLTVAVTPAICEEFFFRGFVLRGFEFLTKPFWAALFTAIIFSFYHVNFYGFTALILIGLYLGYATYKSGSIYIAVIMHFINNFSAVVLYSLFEDEEFINSTGAFQDTWIHLLRFSILLAIFILLIFFIKKYYSKISQKNQEAL